MRRGSQSALAHALISILLAQAVAACTRVELPPVKVSPTFKVYIHYPNGRPVPNIRVTAYELVERSSHSEVAASVVTGKDGTASITLRNLQADFNLAAEHLGVSSEVVRVSLYNDGSGLSELSLVWPGGPLTRIRSASGKLGLASRSVPWVGAHVELRDATSDKSIRESVTDAEGRFSFLRVPPGFYALHIRDAAINDDPVPQLEGNVPIEIRNDAPNDELPLWGFVASDCGLAAHTGENSVMIFAP